MKIIRNKKDFDNYIRKIRKKMKKIGLIPTMGSIHQGHLSLVEQCKKLDFFSIVTIYINPLQFNEVADYEQYPKNEKNDIKSLEKIGLDLLFIPSTKDLYPNEIKSKKTILDYRNILCDNFRPGHFDGVTTVVTSLFKLINPDYAFFGEKDFQQLKIVQQVVKINNLTTVIHPCIAIRMLNGMSLSSRYENFKLSQKKIFDIAADKIKIYLKKLQKNIDNNILDELRIELYKIKIIKIDYLEIRDEKHLLPTIKNRNARLFIAFYIGDIRIIDNFILY